MYAYQSFNDHQKEYDNKAPDEFSAKIKLHDSFPFPKPITYRKQKIPPARSRQPVGLLLLLSCQNICKIKWIYIYMRERERERATTVPG